MNSEEGRRQLVKIKELHLLADRLGCTAAQLAIGNGMSRVHVLWSGILNITMKNIFPYDDRQGGKQRNETEEEKHLVLVHSSLPLNVIFLGVKACSYVG